MRQFIGIDFISGGPMPKPYSQELRMRVIETVEGGASLREAAELYGISPSVVVIWMQRWMASGSIEAKPSGGSTSPLDKHAEFLLGLTVERPDMTLDEIVAAMPRAGIAGVAQRSGGSTNGTTSALKKSLYAAEQKRTERLANVGVGCDSKACLTRPGRRSSTKPARIPVWCAYTGAAPAARG